MYRAEQPSRMAPLWFLLLVVSTVGATLCPDGSACGEKSLCCRLPGNEGFGCCPEGEVVSHSLPMMLSQTSCFGPSGCPDEYSCVTTPQGGSACCPMAQGRSCRDGHHCCSAGSYCSDDGHFCIPASNESAVICPDGKSECPALTTCCLMSDMSSWGCCPMPQAVCCADHMHCCPSNSKCDVQQGRCVTKQDHVPWMQKLPARVRLVVGLGDEERWVQCPDGTSCPDGSTCCEQVDRTYGCCSILSAVCCSDHLHCCPAGTSCDLVHQKCVSSNGEGPLLLQMPAVRQESNRVLCDASTSCPDKNTCCRLLSGKFGCCPYDQAVCCEDQIHCCPNGFTCSDGSCVMAEHSIPWMKKTLAKGLTTTRVHCDETASCPEQETCCRLVSGKWGCCPIEKAVCCDDHLHCCPEGFTCTQGQCLAEELSIPWFSKTPALTHEARDVQCDDMYSCPDGQTCCRLASGDWGCCPIAKAVCCEDHEHCCPPGYTCSGGDCQMGDQSIPWLRKTPALRQKARDVQCDDMYSCPDGQTCCRLASGDWGCCPIAKAVCCEDHEHCCPPGYTCSGGDCQMGDRSIPWLRKTPALRQEARDVQCDDMYSCPDGQTCCRLASGDWGCCPIAKAVCCEDHEHCCPPGYTCSGGDCQMGDQSIPWLRKTPALRQEARDVQCDDMYSCPDGQTCCRLASGDWGCCPIAKAVCCEDHEHCCPPGYTCSGGDCQMGDQSIPWLRKTPALRQEARDVQCDDMYSCPDGQTCCRLASGDWGCCPIAKAVCCEDHEHCCPPGYTCSGGDCQMGDQSIPWLRKTPALRQEARDVQCDDMYSCPDGQTCCRLASGDWGCCPIAKAVCCEDHEHCCPPGYTCSGGDCQMGDQSIPWLRKTPALRQEARDVQCDDMYSCPDGQTCCRLASGDWGCCPIAKAVCCDDHEHCCPPGFTCSGAQCIGGGGGLSIPWFSRTPALRQEGNSVKCDDSFSCGDGQSCCRMVSGEWGCCPIEKAVCCSDHLHCCPSGYTCNVAAGSCEMPQKKLVKISFPGATSALRLNYVWCDAQTYCFDGQTCCRGRGGVWNCCLYTQGVCCPDMVHCCPYGYVCLAGGASCARSGISRWDGKPSPMN
ncbi:granulin L homeolog isoform X2 [Xenopus laevis]|uniref:Granulin L homeolog isoform X2 n=1 Tax=Xenopus laevis TaxID=8355 RepID=A0A8J0TRL1_XENLA|nr:granulin L homeolog isoform X2 [Xenopus laevis]